ncbi:MAG: Gfo/Idh/MocA family oxidoreductase [Synergistaceae bacterium]|jgi:predicted dehydrogenase|nr:Gfo/Idh/MocA family oxidoreductase [Synergistaceae bacterium]
MPGKKKVCIIGAGNISNTRHIPAVCKNKNIEIVGLVSNELNNLTRTQNKYKFIKNSLLIDPKKDVIFQLNSTQWFGEVDAVIIGTPPKEHYEISKICLQLKKHVLVEKPMAMDINQCDDMIEIANNNRVTLNVMHSFNYADGISEMDKRFRNNEFGELRSILEVQLTNRDRRLPKWYNDLPLGLFFDEAAHFFYTAMRFGNGNYSVLNAHAHYGLPKENTPQHLEIQGMVGEIPVQTYMNFNSPVCEWIIMLICAKKIAIYDFFKDILIVADNDKQHLAVDVLRSSMQYTFGYWRGFIINGFKMVTHRLLYGHDKIISEFMENIETKKDSTYISAEMGKKVIIAMNKVVNLAESF